jgi:hypothetical protein
MERQRVVKSAERKDSALMTFESEVETLNNKVVTLSKDLSGRRKINQSGEDPFLIIPRLEEEMNFFDSEARLMADKYKDATARAQNLERETKRVERETDETKELLALAEASLANQSVEIDSKETVERLHETWRELGVNSAVRENSRKEIQSCLGRDMWQEAERSLRAEDADRGRYPNPSRETRQNASCVGGYFRVHQRQVWINVA